MKQVFFTRTVILILGFFLSSASMGDHGSGESGGGGHGYGKAFMRVVDVTTYKVRCSDDRYEIQLTPRGSRGAYSIITSNVAGDYDYGDEGKKRSYKASCEAHRCNYDDCPAVPGGPRHEPAFEILCTLLDMDAQIVFPLKKTAVGILVRDGGPKFDYMMSSDHCEIMSQVERFEELVY